MKLYKLLSEWELNKKLTKVNSCSNEEYFLYKGIADFKMDNLNNKRKELLYGIDNMVIAEELVPFSGRYLDLGLDMVYDCSVLHDYAFSKIFHDINLFSVVDMRTMDSLVYSLKYDTTEILKTAYALFIGDQDNDIAYEYICNSSQITKEQLATVFCMMRFVNADKAAIEALGKGDFNRAIKSIKQCKRESNYIFPGFNICELSSSTEPLFIDNEESKIVGGKSLKSEQCLIYAAEIFKSNFHIFEIDTDWLDEEQIVIPKQLSREFYEIEMGVIPFLPEQFKKTENLFSLPKYMNYLRHEAINSWGNLWDIETFESIEWDTDNTYTNIFCCGTIPIEAVKEISIGEIV